METNRKSRQPYQRSTKTTTAPQPDAIDYCVPGGRITRSLCSIDTVASHAYASISLIHNGVPTFVGRQDWLTRRREEDRLPTEMVA